MAGESNSPAAPVLMATAGADLITISWQPVEGANGYELHGRHGALPWQRLDDGSLTGSSTSFTHTELASETTYYYTGRTVPATGRKSPWAVQVSATVFDASTAPTLAATPAIGQIELSWSADIGRRQLPSHHVDRRPGRLGTHRRSPDRKYDLLQP